MFKVFLNNFVHTTLSSSSQKELDFMILHILNPRQKCLHSGPTVCIGRVFEHSLFSKALWTSSQWCCIYVLQFNQVLIFQFSTQLVGYLAILVFLFCLGSDTSLLLSSQFSSPSRSNHFSLWRWLQASFVSVTHFICPNTFPTWFLPLSGQLSGEPVISDFRKSWEFSRPAGTSTPMPEKNTFSFGHYPNYPKEKVFFSGKASLNTTRYLKKKSPQSQPLAAIWGIPTTKQDLKRLRCNQKIMIWWSNALIR